MKSSARVLLESEVIRLWNDQTSAGKIASRFQETRNVVMGIINRARRKGLITREEISPTTAKPKRSMRPARQQPARVAKPTPTPASKYAGPIVRLFPIETLAGDGPKTLIDAPAFTCRFVVGQNERGQDLYCCEPTYRQKDGEIGRISVCEEHKPRYFQTRRNTEATIDRLSTDFKREKRQHAGSKKFFAFGKTLGISDE